MLQRRLLMSDALKSKHGQDLLYPRGEFCRLTSRDVSLASPYSTFSYMSTLASFSAVEVHLFPSETNDRRVKGDLNWMRPPSTVTGTLRD